MIDDEDSEITISRPGVTEAVDYGESVDESTVVVDRRNASLNEVDESTVVVDRRHISVSEVDESTVVVDRRSSSSSEVDEATVVVARHRDEADESTVVVNRHAPDPEATVVVAAKPRLTESEADIVADDDDGADDDPEATRAVDRGNQRALKKAPPRRRGTLRPAPVSVEMLDRAVPAAGPGAIATYASREILSPPLAGNIDTGAAIARENPAALPSVARRSARTALITFGSVAASIVVAVGGLILIGVWIFG
ncbi:hypothetical protein [Salinibacterium sp. PAMC 21357]|uniref:hypothetical protein n=1 Tax=Salinibacterium sp. PAMC 21357 TaxID=1112215 RepID=UPI00028828FA|nr:hypothetical protein [Salinibacterium sp. PAMC 21357]